MAGSDPIGWRRIVTPLRVVIVAGGGPRDMRPLHSVSGPQGNITPIATAPDPIDPRVRIDLLRELDARD
jgi:hypothetical protein